MVTTIQKSELDELKAENKRLELRVKDLEKQVYGAKADRRPKEDSQQTTFEGIDKTAESADTPAPKPTATGRRKERKGKKKKGPKPLDPNLPRVKEHLADPDLKDLICPVTGQPMKPVFEEHIEVLSRKPAEYYVRVLIRQVFASAGGDAMAYSPWPSSVMPRSRIDASIAASILSSRFADHQPYNRQSEQLKRQGVDLARGTIGSIVQLASEKLKVLYDAIVRQALTRH